MVSAYILSIRCVTASSFSSARDKAKITLNTSSVCLVSKVQWCCRLYLPFVENVVWCLVLQTIIEVASRGRSVVTGNWVRGFIQMLFVSCLQSRASFEDGLDWTCCVSSGDLVSVDDFVSEVFTSDLISEDFFSCDFELFLDIDFLIERVAGGGDELLFSVSFFFQNSNRLFLLWRLSSSLLFSEELGESEEPIFSSCRQNYL